MQWKEYTKQIVWPWLWVASKWIIDNWKNSKVSSWLLVKKIVDKNFCQSQKKPHFFEDSWLINQQNSTTKPTVLSYGVVEKNYKWFQKSSSFYLNSIPHKYKIFSENMPVFSNNSLADSAPPIIFSWLKNKKRRG